jgi:hypothetical protein
MLSRLYKEMLQIAGDVPVTRPRNGAASFVNEGTGSLGALRPDAPAEGSTG